ncbi:MAG TPA: glycoside hydrolase family 76 protein [Longimicrobiales bacterium]
MAVNYLDHARAAAEILTGRWYTQDAPYEWIPQDYWKTPTMAEELVTHMELAGNQDYLPICDATRAAGQGYLTSCAYLDDATVWGRFQVAAYRWLSTVRSGAAGAYLDDADTVYDNLTQQWDDVCGGGLYWKRGAGQPGNFKASNATLGLMEIALGLHASSGDAKQLEWAKRSWQWIETSRLIDTQGLVWGGLTQACEVDPANVPVVALQGNPLQPLWWLYQATGETALLDVGQRVVKATAARFTWSGTSILKTDADAGWRDGGEDYHLDHLNEAMFKGIFMGFVGEFTKNLATLPAYADAAAANARFIRANADALIANYPTGIFSMDWHTSDPSYEGDDDAQVNAALQFSALAALDAAAKVSAIA